MPDIKDEFNVHHHYYHHHRWNSFAQLVVGRLIGVIVFALIFGFVVQLLWNWLMPGLFSLRQITYWEGFGITLLIRILFGSILPHPFLHDDTMARMYFKRFARRDDFWYGRDKRNKWRFYGEYWNEEGREAFRKFVEKREQEMKGKEPAEGEK
jgi:hypothetical protein